METVQTSRTPAAAPRFGEAELKALYEKLEVSAHPILKLPTLAQVQALMATPDGQERFITQLQRRQERIAFEKMDPLNWTFEAETWSDADKLLIEAEGCYLLGIFGGNRAQKTWYAVKRAVESALLFPNSRVAICSESLESSIATVQELGWYYIRRHFEHLNGKRGSAITNINHTQKNGFADGKVIFPNGSQIYFLTYNQETTDFEGWEWGAPMDVYHAVSQRLTEALKDATGALDKEFEPVDLSAWRAQGRTACPNIGAVPDESMPLAWLKMFARRVKFRQAKLLWPFTPVKGITPAIKEMVGKAARTLQSRPSELLPGQNFPDIAKGHMPYIRQCVMPGAKAIYFHTIFNRFGPGAGRTYYDEIAALCAGKTTEYIERVAYGYARDSIARAFPNFGPLNIVKRSQIPATGTNYFFFDPHGTRNFPMIWIRAVPTRPVSWYLYREWPDMPTYGEWAVTTEREVNDQNRKGWDGDAGPAQTGLGWGVERYKNEILRQELIAVPAMLLGNRAVPWNETTLETVLTRDVPDLYWQKRIRQAMRGGENLLELREEIAARYGDPRGIHNEHVSTGGGVTLYDLFEAEQLDAKTGERIAPAMELNDAPTSRRSNAEEADEGITLLNGLLGGDGLGAVGAGEDQMPGVNQPRLFVSEECRQVIWCLENYTGRSGGTGASKDFIDLVKYSALAELEHLETVGHRGRPGKGF